MTRAGVSRRSRSSGSAPRAVSRSISPRTMPETTRLYRSGSWRTNSSAKDGSWRGRGRHAPLDLASGTYVISIAPDRAHRRLRDVGVPILFAVQRRRAIADGSVSHPDPSIEPWTAAEAAQHGDGYSLRHVRSDNRSGVGEVQ